MKITCMHCLGAFEREPGQVRNSARQFCSQRCAGFARRKPKLPKAQRAALKAEYDRNYRKMNAARLKREKAAWFQRNYDPEKQRKKNAARMPEHVVYCRKYYADPKRKAHKVRYDQTRRGLLSYGEWNEAWRLLLRLERAIRKRTPSWYERAKARGYYENRKLCQERKRDAHVSRW